MSRKILFRKFRPRNKVDNCVPSRKIRTINMGANVEQRPWTPTVRRGKIAAESASPGPATVQLPTLVGSKVPDSKKVGAPSYSFGQKHRRTFDTLGPGPAQYNITGLRAKGKDYPKAATLQSRPKELTKFQNPGPGEYDITSGTKATIDTTPKYTFGQKPQAAKFSLIPAPNIYKIPTVLGSSKEGPIRSAPAYTMAGREKIQIPALVMPGPGYYDGEYTVIKTKPPMYSMRGKFSLPNDDDRKPGPGAHCPEKYVEKKSVSAPSFGIVHTPFLGNPNMALLTNQQTRCALAKNLDKLYS